MTKKMCFIRFVFYCFFALITLAIPVRMIWHFESFVPKKQFHFNLNVYSFKDGVIKFRLKLEKASFVVGGKTLPNRICSAFAVLQASPDGKDTAIKALYLDKDEIPAGESFIRVKDLYGGTAGYLSRLPFHYFYVNDLPKDQLKEKIQQLNQAKTVILTVAVTDNGNYKIIDCEVDKKLSPVETLKLNNGNKY